MKIFLLIVLFFSSGFAQEAPKKLVPVIVKPGDCSTMHSGFTCYSDQDFKIMDAQQNDFMKCQAELLKVKTPVIIKKAPECEQAQVSAKHSKNLPLKIGLAALFSFGLGIGLGAMAQ